MSDMPVTDTAVADTAGTGAGAGPAAVGHLLRAAREAKGLSTGAIATQLNLDVRTVEALERDDHERLSAPIFVRGYLRNYARLVGVPEDQVLGPYPVQAPAEPAPRRAGLPRRQRSFSAPRIPWRGLFTLLLLAALGAFAWEYGPTLVARFSGGMAPADTPAALALPGSDGAAETAGRVPPTGALDLQLPEAPAAGADIGEPIPLDEVEPVLPPEAEMEPGAGSAADVRPEADAPAPATPEIAGSPAAEMPPPEMPAAEIPAAEMPPAEPAVPDHVQLELRFSGESWVEISAADGRRLLYGLMRADEQRSVAGPAPLRVLLGNATAVDLKVDGAAFDLGPHMHGAVARFRLDPGH